MIIWKVKSVLMWRKDRNGATRRQGGLVGTTEETRQKVTAFANTNGGVTSGEQNQQAVTLVPPISLLL